MSWDRVTCHPSVKKIILRSIKNGMFRGTHMLYGPRGAGQVSVARAIAKTWVCQSLELDFCDDCTNCRRVDQRAYPDVIEMKPEKTVYLIDQMREMQQQALVQPYEADVKLFLLHDAHKMQDPSANSLLKILEEPYPHNLFLLLTDTPSAILGTIHSRCRKIRLAPLSVSDLQRDLQSQLGPEAAETIARAAGGLPELAQEIQENNYLADRDELLEQMRQIRAAESHIPEITKVWAKKKDRLEDIFTILMGFVRDGVLLTSGMREGPLLNPDRREELAALWENEKPERMLQRFEKVAEAIYMLQRNLNPNTLVENLLIELRPQIS